MDEKDEAPKPRQVAKPKKRKRRRMRSWPLELKVRIVGESFEDGATVAGVARQHGLAPSQLSEWRRLARAGKLKLPQVDDVGFASVAVIEADPITTGPQMVTHPFAQQVRTIDVIKGNITLRLPVDSAPSRIAEIASAL